MRNARLLCLCIAALLTVGCAAPPPARFTINQDQYDAAFNAVRDTLRDRRFDLARVDARAGVITTLPASSVGLASPWIDHTDTPGDAVTGLMQHERRRVEVRFLPAGATPDSITPETDVRAQAGPYDVDVRVIVERIYQPGRRPDATSVRVGGFSQDPELVARGDQPRYAIDHRDDPRLAGHLARDIQQEFAGPDAPRGQ